MKALRSKILKYVVTLTFCASIFMVTTGDAQGCDYDTVLANCIATASEDHSNGDISLAVFREFVYHHCPVAASSCN